ncbi:hypothetical protein J1N35_037369 [Gossypium stocksii]|uniref:DUF4371 domain-containing protein n=1 Tax=Gossypium stocksii TaxID=47602 RepID=A0A9D3UJR6_9ROSI|nr:hypothetical protein J1N35_037369 [Gossypium stocksii]
MEKNQISDLPKLLNEISSLLNFKLLNAISSLPKLLNEISCLLNLKKLNEISSLSKLLNEILGLLKFLNVLFGSYQSVPPTEALTSPQYINKNECQFLPSWYKLFLDWLEFSSSKNVTYCLPYFIFNEPFGHYENIFTSQGFQSWKKVNERSKCLFATHVDKDANSLYKNEIINYRDLQNSLQNIESVIEKQNSEQFARNQLQLKMSIDVVKWLIFQGYTFRGCDEAQHSRNRSKFLELIKLLTSYNEDVGTIVLKNAPQNA